MKPSSTTASEKNVLRAWRGTGVTVPVDDLLLDGPRSLGVNLCAAVELAAEPTLTLTLKGFDLGSELHDGRSLPFHFRRQHATVRPEPKGNIRRRSPARLAVAHRIRRSSDGLAQAVMRVNELA